MTFQEAVEAAPMPVCESYRPGKQALKAGHREQDGGWGQVLQ
jgi:hypothetical protein